MNGQSNQGSSESSEPTSATAFLADDLLEFILSSSPEAVRRMLGRGRSQAVVRALTRTAARTNNLMRLGEIAEAKHRAGVGFIQAHERLLQYVHSQRGRKLTYGALSALYSKTIRNAHAEVARRKKTAEKVGVTQLGAIDIPAPLDGGQSESLPSVAVGDMIRALGSGSYPILSERVAGKSLQSIAGSRQMTSQEAWRAFLDEVGRFRAEFRL